jgi:hypothetical protein
MAAFDPNDWHRLRELFDRLVETDAAQRPRLLDELTRDAPELRERLERLLALDAGQDHFMTVVAAARTELLDADEAPPASIGPWRALRVLGTGGMGRVYLAERADGSFERRVAMRQWSGSLPKGGSSPVSTIPASPA